MRLELSSEEQDLLLELLDRYMRDLKDEISNTDSPFFRDALKERQALLVGLLEKVQKAARAG